MNHRNQSSDRLPPNDAPAEQGVLGCILLDAQNPSGSPTGEALEECLRRRVEPTHFYDLRHQILFRQIRDMAAAGRPADMVLLSGEMSGSGDLAKIGGIAYLNELCGAVPSAGNLSYYLDVVLEKHALRHVIRIASKAVADAFAYSGDVKQFVGEFETSALELSESHVPTEFKPLPTYMPAYIDAIEKRHRGKQEITGLATPFWYLNNMTCGLQPGEYVVIGARPSTGKTAIALDLLRHTVKAGKAVLFFSIEMTQQQIMERIVAAEATVDGQKLRNGFWTDEKEPAIVAATGRVAAWNNFLIDTRSVCTGQDVFIGARRAQRQHDIGLVMIDYIQLMQSVRQYNSRMEAVAEASAWLKRTAKDLGIAVVACAQLSRDSEKERAGKQPLMSDLRECGNIEQDADVIALLYEPKLDDSKYDDMKWIEHHKPDDPKEDSEWNTAGSDEVRKGSNAVMVNGGWREEFRRINLAVAKNRNGATGPCELVFQRRSARFVDAHSPSRTKADRGTLI